MVTFQTFNYHKRLVTFQTFHYYKRLVTFQTFHYYKRLITFQTFHYHKRLVTLLILDSCTCVFCYCIIKGLFVPFYCTRGLLKSSLLLFTLISRRFSRRKVVYHSVLRKPLLSEQRHLSSQKYESIYVMHKLVVYRMVRLLKRSFFFSMSFPLCRMAIKT